MNHNTPPTEEIAFEGRIGEIVHAKQPDGRIFEYYRRPPGVRLVIVTPDNKILVTKEHRRETGGIDLRLPGGKVRDTLEEYHQLLASGQDMTQAAAEAAAKEALEETGLIISNPQLLTRANAGATVEWDLYYFLVEQHQESQHGQELEQGEDIEMAYLTPAEVRKAVTKGEMQEWRSVGVLLGMVLPRLEQSA